MPPTMMCTEVTGCLDWERTSNATSPPSSAMSAKSILGQWWRLMKPCAMGLHSHEKMCWKVGAPPKRHIQRSRILLKT